MEYLLIGGGWAVYLGLHSILASNHVKQRVALYVPGLFQVYRLVYSLLSGLGMLFMLYLMAITPSQYLFEPSGPLRYVAMVLTSWGVILVMVSFRHISGLAFLGLKKNQNRHLVREGVHRYLRHPLYAGTILVLLGMVLYVPTDLVIVSVVVNLIYLPLGIHLEEQKLIREYGDAYLEYKREVKAIIPGVF